MYLEKKHLFFPFIHRELLSLKKEHDTVEGELRTLRETFNLRQDTWIKEKLAMQVRIWFMYIKCLTLTINDFL